MPNNLRYMQNKVFYFNTKKWIVFVTGMCVFIFLFLQFVSYMIVWKFNHEKEKGKFKHLERHQNLKLSVHKLQEIFNKVVLSSDGLYQIIYDVTDVSSKDDSKLTLITHCSVNHFHKVFEILKIWDGPVVVSVYIPADVLQSLWNIFLLCYCQEYMVHQLAIHIVTDFPNNISSDSIAESYHEQINCSEINLLGINYGNRHNYDYVWQNYPNNLLRNVGIHSVKTEYILVIDVDILPSRNAFKNIDSFLQRRDRSKKDNSAASLSAYVIPVFEVRENVNIPTNKKDLLLLWKQQKVQPFYFEVCKKCHHPLNYKLWNCKLPLC